MALYRFQEIVPLNAGNILGVEDNGPAKKWLGLINQALNKDVPGATTGSGHYTPSLAPAPVAEWNADFGGSSSIKHMNLFPRRSFQSPQFGKFEVDVSGTQPRHSVCDRVIFGHRPSDGSSSRRPSEDSSSCPRASDFSSSRRPSDYSWGQRVSDCSRWGSEEDYLQENSPCTVLRSPRREDASYQHSKYSLIASKQMVGIFLTVWVRSDLDEHVKGVKVSCVGRGLMGYLGNKVDVLC